MSRERIRRDIAAMPARRQRASTFSIIIYMIGLGAFGIASGPAKWFFIALLLYLLVDEIIYFGQKKPHEIEKSRRIQRQMWSEIEHRNEARRERERAIRGGQ